MDNQVLVTQSQTNFWKMKNSSIRTSKTKSRVGAIKDLTKHEQLLKSLLKGEHHPFSQKYIGDLMELHFEKCPKTKVADRKNSFLWFCQRFSKVRLNELTISELKNWFDEIKQARNYSDITLCHIRGNLGHFFNFLVDEGILLENPLLKLKFKRNPPPKRQRVYLTEEELQKILLNAKEYSPFFLYPFFYCLIHTGARRSEVMNLTWRDIDFSKGTMTFRETKNGTNRTIKMNPQLFDVIYEMASSIKRRGNFVFTNPQGEQIGRSQLGRHVNSFKLQYPISKNWHCHAFRHSYAYNALKHGMNMYEIQAILGHKSIQLTIDLYGKLLSEDIEHSSPYKF